MLKIVLSAPSGAGKTTIWKKLLEREKNIIVSISCTTRKKRKDEREDVDYYFVTREEFVEKINSGELLEWAEVHGNYYGSPKSNLELAEKNNKDILFEVDVQGARSLKEKLPDAVLVFIMPPDLSELKRRLEIRGQDEPEEVKRRLIHAKDEIESAEDFDYVIVNDDVEKAVAQLQSIIEAERLKTSKNRELIKQVLSSA